MMPPYRLGDPRWYLSQSLVAMIRWKWHPVDAHELVSRLLLSYGRDGQRVQDVGEIAMEPWVGCLHPGAEETWEHPYLVL